MTRIFYKVVIGVLSLIVSVVGGQFLLETYFFDSVIYQKWSWYGYTPNEISFNLAGAKEELSWPVRHRLTDLVALWDKADQGVPLKEKNEPVFLQ